jgi:predicted membrane-bound spermidine synthase
MKFASSASFVDSIQRSSLTHSIAVVTNYVFAVGSGKMALRVTTQSVAHAAFFDIEPLPQRPKGSGWLSFRALFLCYFVVKKGMNSFIH